MVSDVFVLFYMPTGSVCYSLPSRSLIGALDFKHFQSHVALSRFLFVWFEIEFCSVSQLGVNSNSYIGMSYIGMNFYLFIYLLYSETGFLCAALATLNSL